MTLSEKSLITLELPAVLEMLAAEAISQTAKDAAFQLRPFTDIHLVQMNLSETTAAKNMMTLRQSPPFSGVKDIRGPVKRADMGGALNTRELLDVAELLRASAASITYWTKDKEPEKTAIDYLFTSLISNKPLENKISAAIISEEEISDNASRELADIRRHMRLAGEKIRQALNKIITSPAYSKALQEPLITMRNDRYVVPVKAEHKTNVPGLLHDISSSGATLFIEPTVVVNTNNELRELAAKEKQEIERILMELSADVSDCSGDLTSDFEVLAKLDLIFAKAKLSYKFDALEPELSGEKLLSLNNARHPLLPKGDAVPITILLGGAFDTLIITGPNTGGKTVTLKTLGLLCAMVQCGLHIPVNEGSVVPVFDLILADVGDEQSIEQSLSTFSSHMTNIVGILDICDSDSLLLFDELGAGTDPVEGAALGIAIIEHARKAGALIAATTHYAELKSYAVASKGVTNASCEFDVETLKPTYKLTIGIPGKSYAFAISKRLGLSDAVIDDARERVTRDNAVFEDALAGLEETRLKLESEKSESEKLLRDAQADRKQASQLKTRLEKDWGKETGKAKREAAKILDDTRKTAESVMDDLRKMRRIAAIESDWEKINEEKSELFRRLNEAGDALDEANEEAPVPPASREIVQGDRVLLKKFGTFADVVSINADGVLSLQAGIMKITAKSDEVTLVEDEAQSVIKKQIAEMKRSARREVRDIIAKPEIDLRGMTAFEAITALERFIDNARLAKLGVVTVIHGKGTGVLRRAVHNSLRQDLNGIKSFRLGVYGEGEDGVTLVELE